MKLSPLDTAVITINIQMGFYSYQVHVLSYIFFTASVIMMHPWHICIAGMVSDPYFFTGPGQAKNLWGRARWVRRLNLRGREGLGQ